MSRGLGDVYKRQPWSPFPFHPSLLVSKLKVDRVSVECAHIKKRNQNSSVSKTPLQEHAGSLTNWVIPHCSVEFPLPTRIMGSLSKRLLEPIVGFGLWLGAIGEGLRKQVV